MNESPRSQEQQQLRLQAAASPQTLASLRANSDKVVSSSPSELQQVAAAAAAVNQQLSAGLNQQQSAGGLPASSLDYILSLAVKQHQQQQLIQQQRQLQQLQHLQHLQQLQQQQHQQQQQQRDQQREQQQQRQQQQTSAAAVAAAAAAAAFQQHQLQLSGQAVAQTQIQPQTQSQQPAPPSSQTQQHRRQYNPSATMLYLATNECRVIDYRGHKIAAFLSTPNPAMLQHLARTGQQAKPNQSEHLLCLPQAFEVFLKHLVGGLHTVYTKLKRLDIVPIVCNVEQVRILRGYGAIQPGVNRCKLLSTHDFDILFKDCTTAR